jgi:catechol 2,3-dioxygenase-like lactoylglutathione lyase family enzyme
MADMKLEVIVIPVSDIDRTKRFYGGLGWRLDADFSAPDGFRVIQFTPPGSSCSVHFGTARPGVGSAAPAGDTLLTASLPGLTRQSITQNSLCEDDGCAGQARA